MSRRKRNKTFVPQQQVQISNASEKKIRILLILIFLLPAAVFFAFGKYFEFATPDPYDGGAYVYSAKHLLEGAQLGVEEVPSAQPGTLLFNIIGVKLFGFSDTGPKLMQMLLQLAALAAMFLSIKKLFTAPAAVISVTLASLYLSAPVIAKQGNVKEQYMIAFMIMAASAWIYYELTQKKLWIILTGAALVWPYYFKATGLTIDIAFVVYFLARIFFKHIPPVRGFRELLLLFAGGAASLLPLAAMFLWQNRLDDFLDTLPVVMIKLGIFITVLAAAVYTLKKVRFISLLRAQLKQVRPVFWIAGLILIAVVLTGTLIYFYIKHPGDVGSYWNSLFFMRVYHRVTGEITRLYRTMSAFAGSSSVYISGSRAIYSWSRQAPIVLRYYSVMSLPIAAAAVSILAAGFLRIRTRLNRQPLAEPQHRVVWLLACWWALDMIFAWISPHSYEQYYLPLCASAAMLSGYSVWLFMQRLKHSPFKPPYYIASAAALAVMLPMAWPVLFGLKKSPFSGQPYPEPARGYKQMYEQVRTDPEYAWIKIGRYIREHSDPQDKIYVWGWYPGIYVQAQRMAPVSKAFEGDMHIVSPQSLRLQADGLVRAFEKNPPKFIVDTLKNHFPFDRPPFELWPRISSPKDRRQLVYLPNNPEMMRQYEEGFADALEKRFGDDEARRFEAVKPLRDFVMNNYRIVPGLSYPNTSHVLFERIEK